MLGKQELIDRLTGIRSSRKSYYSELSATVEELKKKNKQLEVINRLAQIHVEKSWEEVSVYLAAQLSQIVAFDRFMLTLADQTGLLFHAAEREGESWSCRFVKRRIGANDAWTPEEFDRLLQEVTPGYYSASVGLQYQTGKIYGYLTLQNRQNKEYSREELELYQRLGEHARISIENILLFKDVSEKINLEAQLIQSAKMAALGEMAAGIAHELNSPLTAILGHVQLLMRAMKEGRHGKMLADIYQCGLRCTKIIQNLLIFSRQEEVQPETIQLSELIDDVLGLVGYQLVVSGITVRKETEQSLPSVRGSRNQIEQVIINLLLNARDAVQGKNDPEITVGTCLTRLEERLFVSVYVRDNGVGIAGEHLSQIFNPFFTTKERMKGTGLGLSVSLGIAESHGGKLLVDSRVGEYSVFSLLLPVPDHEGED
ncbi:sensor histidine kinase [Paenibacillus ginsengihumi]|uniref:sensor histidine kinase n=1 Tax=Paenibacillus ginsengihumi TaxID=431596 RepID=UPI0003661CC2|nr:ATP-binding protein [Paenibacillus ginsengihumi]